MPHDIIDNRELQLADAVRPLLSESVRAHFAVGYFFLSGFKAIGEPRIEKLKPAYGKALNILNKMPVQKDFVIEQDAQKFSEQLADEMAKHAA